MPGLRANAGSLLIVGCSGVKRGQRYSGSLVIRTDYAAR
jgi:hypothetical protein